MEQNFGERIREFLKQDEELLRKAPLGSLLHPEAKCTSDPLEGIVFDMDFPELPSEEEVYRDAVPSYSDSLIESYQLFKQKIYSPQKVLYPSCDLDASPIRAFPDAEVDLVDINNLAVSALNRNGINATHSDIRDFSSNQNYDLVILLNPTFSSEWIFPFLGPRGYVLANNWHGNASQLAENSMFENIGTINNVPIKNASGNWDYRKELTLGEMKGLGKVADNLWIYRRKE